MPATGGSHSEPSPGATLGWLGYLVRRNVLVLVGATLLGGAVGVGLSTLGGGYSATVVLAVQSSGDAGQTVIAVQSAAVAATSDVVLQAAADRLGVDPAVLGRRVTSTVQPDTTFIDLTVIAPTPDEAVAAATAVADTALADYQARNEATADEVRTKGEDLLQTGTLSAEAAERARQDSIGTVVGQAQGQAIEGAVALSIASPASQASPAGVGRTVAGILGAAAGFLLALLVTLTSGWRARRRIRNLADLLHTPGLRGAVDASQTELLAGQVLESGKALVAVLDTRPGPFATEGLVDGLHLALERSGVSVGRVVVEGDQPVYVTRGDGGAVATLERDSAAHILGRAERSALPRVLDAEVVLVACPARLPAAALLHGQSDFFAVLVVRPRTRVRTVQQEATLLAAAEPVGVLLP